MDKRYEVRHETNRKIYSFDNEQEAKDFCESKPDGGWCVVDTWDAQSILNTFVTTKDIKSETDRVINKLFDEFCVEVSPDIIKEVYAEVSKIFDVEHDKTSIYYTGLK